MISIVVGILSVIIAFWLWCYIHEMSHILMAKKLVGLKWYKLKLYPHIHRDTLRMASCRYMPARKRTDNDIAAIAMAPRIPNLLAAILLPLGTFFLSGLLLEIWIIFLGAGVVDLIWGSVGHSKYSDLQIAAKARHNTPTAPRLAGLLIAALTLAITVTLLII